MKSGSEPRTLLAAALYAGLALAYSWPILPSFASSLPSRYRRSWTQHLDSLVELAGRAADNAVVERADERSARGALAFSETLLGLTPVSLPLLLAGVPPVAVYNVVFLISMPACAPAAHVLARRLTGREDAAILAGLAFGFSPCRLGQISCAVAGRLLDAAWIVRTAHLARPAALAVPRTGSDVPADQRPDLRVPAGLLFGAVILWIAWFVRSWLWRGRGRAA